jgi:ABC-type dipeptide/oligopeptide/nickel transport system permease component
VLNFVLRRLFALPLVMLAVTVGIVGLLQLLTPQERAAAYITNEQQLRNIDKIVKQHGLDQPFFVQYFNWLGSALQGDLGFSKSSGKPVLETIRERFPYTLELALFASIPIVLFGVWVGTAAALNKDRLIDQVARVLAVVGYSVPSFVLGILLLVFFYGQLGILPGYGNISTENSIALITGAVPTRTGLLSIDALLAGNIPIFLDVLSHLILPVLTLSTVISANLMLVMRAGFLDIMRLDYIRTARSKGLSDRVVNGKHARRNALLPIVTLGSFVIQGLLGGSLFTETIFAYPGIGSWGADAASKFDIAGVMGFALLSAIIAVLGNLMADIMYTVVDPRVRFD